MSKVFDGVLQRQAAVSVIVGVQLVKLHQVLSHIGLLDMNDVGVLVGEGSSGSPSTTSAADSSDDVLTWMTLIQW
jgi:hypothetical protein